MLKKLLLFYMFIIIRKHILNEKYFLKTLLERILQNEIVGENSRFLNENLTELYKTNKNNTKFGPLWSFMALS